MKNTSKWLDNLKIRGSFGLVGSDKMDQRFGYLQYFNYTRNYRFGEQGFEQYTGDNSGIEEGDLNKCKS